MPQRSLIIFCIFIASLHHLSAQIIPAENDTLNYRLVGFRFFFDPEADSCLFEIARGRINNNYDFGRNIIISTTTSENRIIETVPEFGQDYTWRISYLNKKHKLKGKSPLYHFTTGYVSLLDSNHCRINILANEGKHNDLLFFIDNPPVMYNMKGEPLWYLPRMPGIDNENNLVRDLKPTPSGTLTCITEKGIYEVDYNGHVLWTGPDSGTVSGESSEHYHHQLTKLANGHYMVPGTKDALVEFTVSDTGLLQKDNTVIRANGKLYKKTSLGTLIEYDPSGKVLWRWYSSDYFTREPAPFPFHFTRGEIITDTHMNGFYFNEKDSIIYVSFKFISHILKVKYPSGEVISDYGNESTLPDGNTEVLFNNQHNCQLSRDGHLYLFNNNMKRGATGISYVSVFKEPQKTHEPLIKTWEFSCDIDDKTASGANVGGSVYMLNDHSIFSCVGTAGRLFIVSEDKKLLWNAIPETHIEKEWRPLRQYKVSVIETPEQLEQLIFHTTNDHP